MHRPIASDHVIPEHVWSVHTEHDLWPWGRTRQGSACGKLGEGAGQKRKVLKALGAGLDRAGADMGPFLYQGLLPTQDPGRWWGGGEGHQNLLARCQESEPGCCLNSVTRQTRKSLQRPYSRHGTQLETVPRASLGSLLSDGSSQTQACNTGPQARGAGLGMSVGEVREKAKAFRAPSFKY